MATSSGHWPTSLGDDTKCKNQGKIRAITGEKATVANALLLRLMIMMRTTTTRGGGGGLTGLILIKGGHNGDY